GPGASPLARFPRNKCTNVTRPMPYKFFVIPIRNLDAAEREMTAFLRRHRVLAVDRRWVEQGAESFWGFCIDYLDGAPASAPPALASPATPPGPPRMRPYRYPPPPPYSPLSPRLRDLRKQIASADAVPVYTIFTNEQLAQMVQQRHQQGGPGEDRRHGRRPAG